MAKKAAVKSFIVSKYIYAVIFVIGALAFAYPLVSSMYNAQTQTRVIAAYQEEVDVLDEEKKQAALEDAQAYNDFVASLEGNVTDEITPEEEAATDVVYMSVLTTGEAIGYIEIPKIDIQVAIFRGSSDAVLDKGIGHIERSSLPVGGESTHSVLAGHRGLPSARLFRDLDMLKEGDLFIIDTLGEKLAYEVETVNIVLPNEVESLQIQEGRDLCTLVTCDPYMINSHRMLVTGHRVDYSPDVVEEAAENSISFLEKYREYFVIVGFFALLMLVVWIVQRRVRRARASSKIDQLMGDGENG